ncbi:MAG: hypothetical protein GY928_15645 [Colwellia sp.]|nr:hypothetical protein [Colwellia sp.]
MAYSQEIKNEAMKAKEVDQQNREDGMSGRSNASIALEFLGDAKKENTIRNWWRTWPKNEANSDLPVNALTKDEYSFDEIDEALLNELIKGDDKSYANLARRLRTAQRTCNQLRKIHRGTVDGNGETPTQTVESIIESLSSRINKNSFTKPTTNVVVSSTKRTVEILFSDLQIGKCSEYYNTKVAKKALAYYGQEVLKTVQGVRPEHIVFASLGDIVEDHLKHGVQSAISTDTGLAEQMADAIEHVWHSVLDPLFSLGMPVTFIGIQGNHGSSEHKGMDMYRAGRYGYDYTIYKTWQTMCNIAGYNHVEFKLPVGCFETHDIYGQKYLYEHGYSNQVNEKQMEDHKKKRQENLKQYIHGYRQGDKHHSVQYDNSNLMCNGAFFGIEQQGAEYSGILGFNSIPVQAVVIHEPVTGVGESTISGVVQIQIAKGY